MANNKDPKIKLTEFGEKLLALFVCASKANTVAWAFVVLRPTVCRSVKPVFSVSGKRLNANFCRKGANHHMSSDFVCFFRIVDF